MYVSSSSRVIDSVCAVAEACGWILAASATLRVSALVVWLRNDTVSVYLWYHFHFLWKKKQVNK